LTPRSRNPAAKAQFRGGAFVALAARGMKTEMRLQIAALGRSVRLTLSVVVMIAWVVVILGMLADRQTSSPDSDRTSPSDRSVAATLRLV
jgi:hypothetical protein